MALFSMDGVLFLDRWLHVLFGIIWIGLLYYFNFVQGAFLAEADAPTKSMVIRKLVPRALWWFRYAALYTFITGSILLTGYFHLSGLDLVYSQYGTTILLGAALGTTMFLNVWLIIWPKQQIVIANAEAVAAGQAAISGAADAGARALVASRTNTLLSFPMLFGMLGARHFASLEVNGDTANYSAFWAIFFVLLLVIQINAIKGSLGPIASVKGVIWSGIALTGLFYGLMEVML